MFQNEVITKISPTKKSWKVFFSSWIKAFYELITLDESLLFNAKNNSAKSKAQEARNKFGTSKKKMKSKNWRYYIFLFVWDISNDSNMTSQSLIFRNYWIICLFSVFRGSNPYKSIWNKKLCNIWIPTQNYMIYIWKLLVCGNSFKWTKQNFPNFSTKKMYMMQFLFRTDGRRTLTVHKILTSWYILNFFLWTLHAYTLSKKKNNCE